MKYQDFWREKWQRNETLWKGDHVNDVLLQFIPTLQQLHNIRPPARALVPLCGDSPALRMLYDAGYSVTGVEYAPEGVASLIRNSFPELDFIAGKTLKAPRIEIVQADFLSYQPDAPFSFIYDRAGYVALSSSDRRTYAKVITNALEPGAILLSRTAELIGAPWEMGPPFSVTFEELKTSFSALQLVAHSFEDAIATQPRFSEAGITTIRHLNCIMKKV